METDTEMVSAERAEQIAANAEEALDSGIDEDRWHNATVRDLARTVIALHAEAATVRQSHAIEVARLRSELATREAQHLAAVDEVARLRGLVDARNTAAELRDEAWRAGAEAMRAACVVGAESFDGRLPRGDGSVTALACFNALEARRVIVDAIRNLPLPEVSR